MNLTLVILGLILLIFGYLIGIKGRIELLTFVRNRYVKDKKKVANILGSSQFLLGAFLITLGGIGFENDPLIILFVVIILLILSMYVIRKYIE